METYTEEDLQAAYDSGYERGFSARKKENAAEWKKDVERRIGAMDWVYDDPTGQDAEDFLRPLYEELIDARDYELRETDPERYSELKAMGQLR